MALLGVSRLRVSADPQVLLFFDRLKLLAVKLRVVPWKRKVVSVLTQLYLSRGYWAPFLLGDTAISCNCAGYQPLKEVDNLRRYQPVGQIRDISLEKDYMQPNGEKRCAPPLKKNNTFLHAAAIQYFTCYRRSHSHRSLHGPPRHGRFGLFFDQQLVKSSQPLAVLHHAHHFDHVRSLCLTRSCRSRSTRVSVWDQCGCDRHDAVEDRCSRHAARPLITL